MTTTPNPAELSEEIKRLERELCDIERRHCIGKAGALDIVGIRSDLHAAIDQLRDLASGPSAGAEALSREDARRYCDPGFQSWLDDSITENAEFTVWDTIKNVHDAYSAWCARPYYAAPAATPPAEKEVRLALTDEQIEAGEDEFEDGARAPDYYHGFYHGIKFAEREHGITAAALSTDGRGHER